ncbi:hypothetical protein [Azospirillum argentinense]
MAKPPLFTDDQVFALLDQMAAKGEHISAYRLKQLHGGRQERFAALIDQWKERGGQPVDPDTETQRVIYDILERQLPIVRADVLLSAAGAVAAALKAKETS